MSRQHGRPVGQQTGMATTHSLPTPAGGVRLETFVPWELVRRGVRRQVVTPSGEPLEIAVPAAKGQDAKAEAPDTPLLRALGLAHHWQRLLDEGRCAGLREIAEAEGMDPGQASRILRLTLLSPLVIEIALRQGALKAGLSELLRGTPPRWDAQERQFVGRP